MPDPVSPADAAEVLAVAAIYDEREPSIYAAREWASALNQMGITAHEAAAAVRHHYIDNPDTRVKPGHLRPIVWAARAEAAGRERARAAIEAADRPGVLPPGELHRRLGEAIDQAQRAKVRRGAQAVQAVAGCRCRVVETPGGAGVRLQPETGCPTHGPAARAAKIPHPSGDDGGDGMAWYPDGAA